MRKLSTWHAAAVAVGMVVGAGIFKTSANVAGIVGDPGWLLGLWAAGGLFALMGALCYAELSAAFASRGGDYGFLRAAFGKTLAFLFAWSRFAVIFTGSTALLAFVLADYLDALFALGPWGRGAIAGGAVLALAALNLRGIRFGADTQVGLVTMNLLGLLALGAAAALFLASGDAPPAMPAPGAPGLATAGAAMVFVMLAYGGWNDAATLSSDLRDGPKAMVPALVGGMGAVTALYLLANWAYLSVLGVGGLAASGAPAADTMAAVFGIVGKTVMVTLVSAAALAIMNALIIVGGRTLYAAALDQPALARLAVWDEARGVPRAAIVVQTAVALLLILWGTVSGRGFAQMVEFLSPVFWLFLALSGVALIVLRVKEPRAPRPFRVPFYPLPPLLFALSSVGVLVSAVRYVGPTGTLVSFGVLALGLVALGAMRLMRRG